MQRHAKQARASMEAAFEDTMVTDFDNFSPVAAGIPDPADHHVVAAAGQDASRNDRH